jgi:phosphoribosylformylglycinamidine cyclo-ligase
LTDAVANSPIDGQLVLSTRTYAPIIKKILDKYTQTKYTEWCIVVEHKLKFYILENLHIIKDNLSVPPLSVNSRAIKTDWKRCIKFSTAVIAWNCTFEAIAQDITFPNPLTSMLK